MRNYTLTIVSVWVSLLLLFSCNRIDTAFVEQMQAGIRQAGENREALEAGRQKARELFERMEKAPEGLKNNPAFGYADLYARVVQLHDGCLSSVVNQDQMVQKVESVQADYVDGKIDKKQAQQEVEVNLKNFQGYRERVGYMNTLIEDATKAYDDMLARWGALPEAEKIASAKMPAPKLPEAVNLKGGSTLFSTGAAPASPAESAQSAAPGALSPNAAPAPTSAGPSLGGQQPGTLVRPSQQQQQTQSPAPAPSGPASLVPPKREQ